MNTEAWLWLAGAYLMGSIPFGLLIANLKGVDIRKVGSGNIGATNVFRSIGKSWGVLTFTLDALKGFAPAFLFPMIGKIEVMSFQSLETPFGLLCGVAAILGHNFPVFLRFKGGKGVATSAGVLVGIAPAAVGIGLVAWIVIFALSRYVSLASILSAVVVPVAGWFLYHEKGLVLPIVLLILAALLIYRHKGNIQRLMAGTENRFGRQKAEGI